MTDNEVLAAFTQLTTAMVKHAKFGPDIKRLESEAAELRRQEKESYEYLIRCKATIEALAAKTAKEPAVDQSRPSNPLAAKMPPLSDIPPELRQIVNVSQMIVSPPIVAGPVPTLSKPKGKG